MINIQNNLMERACKNELTQECELNYIATLETNDPRKYQNRKLRDEINRYNKKLERKMQKMETKKNQYYNNKFSIDNWVDEYWLLNCKHLRNTN